MADTGTRKSRRSYREEHPLTDDERDEIVLAVKSAFKKLRNLYNAIVPIFQQYGFTPPSAGVIARDLSEKIETSIVQHCNSFQKGVKFADLQRFGRPWEVKICKGNGLTINQSKVIDGENYIVVNYGDHPSVGKVWVLWEAEDQFFTERKANSNARTVDASAAQANVEVIYRWNTANRSSDQGSLPLDVGPSAAPRTSKRRRNGAPREPATNAIPRRRA